MTLSVIILNWNGEKLLKSFLPSVVAHSQLDGVEVIVADNGSSDNSVTFIKQHYPNVRLILFDKNYGFTGGYNRAIEQVDSKYVLLLNSDVEVTPLWLEPLIATIESSDKIAAVMPKILSINNRQKFEYAGAAGGYIDYLGLPYCRGRVLSATEEDKGQYNNEVECFWASGAAMLINRELYTNIGGLDIDFFAHMEEIDLCWRVKNMGYKVICNPNSVVYHLGGATLSNESPHKLFLNFRNSLFMLYKNLPSSELFIVIFLRMCFDGFIGLGYLLSGKWAKFCAVIKAHIAFYKNLPLLRAKRKVLHQQGKSRRKSLLLWLVIQQQIRG